MNVYTPVQRLLVLARARHVLREWDESEHPRDDDGKFTFGGGGDETGGGLENFEFHGADNAKNHGVSAGELRVMKEEVKGYFPGLNTDEIKIDGPPDYDYNCIAWALGDTNRPWWPGGRGAFYWPTRDDKPTERTFEKVLIDKGHAIETENQEVEKGYVKLALFKSGDRVTHLARQYSNGEWSSKVGPYLLMRHGKDIFNMNDGDYGHVAKLYKIKESDWLKLRHL